MELKLNKDTFIRSINGYAYLINQRTKKEKIFDESAFLFLSEITRENQDSEIVLSRILKTFPTEAHKEITQDFHDFIQELSNDQFVLSGSTLANNQEFSNVTKNESKGNEVKETSEFLNKILTEKPFLFSIQIELLSACNESCIHCYIPKSTRNHQNYLHSETIFNIIEQAKETGVLSISFTGGEPFLHKNFSSILRKARENDFIITILSNLTIISQDDIGFLKSLNIYNIQVSLYSMNPDIHDSITGLKNSFKKTTENIERLLKAGIPIEVSCPIIKENKDCYVSVLEWCNQRGIKVYTDFNITAMTDFSKSNLVHRLSYEDLKHTLSDILKNDKKYNIFSIRAKQTILNSQPVKFSAFKSIAVSSMGKYIPDIGWNDFILGDIKNDLLTDVWNNSEKLKLLRSLKFGIFPQCNECGASGYCTLCLSWNYYENGGDIYNIPDNFCESIFLIKNLIEFEKMKGVFKFPRTATITSRTSTITNAFVNAIIPRIKPNYQQIIECLNILGMNENNIRCVYCGDSYTEWDHFRPVVKDKLPTGFITDIYNLVPSCSTCNSSKVSKDWLEFMNSDSDKSPKSKNVINLQFKIEMLTKYDNWSRPKTIFIDFNEIEFKNKLQDYLKKRDEINTQIFDAQKTALSLKNELTKLISKP